MELVGPRFKTLAKAATHEVAHDEAHEKTHETHKKAREAALPVTEQRRKLVTQVIFDIEGLSNDEEMFILPVVL